VQHGDSQSFFWARPDFSEARSAACRVSCASFTVCLVTLGVQSFIVPHIVTIFTYTSTRKSSICSFWLRQDRRPRVALRPFCFRESYPLRCNYTAPLLVESRIVQEIALSWRHDPICLFGRHQVPLLELDTLRKLADGFCVFYRSTYTGRAFSSG
jgi:hypothetical protein